MNTTIFCSNPHTYTCIERERERAYFLNIVGVGRREKGKIFNGGNEENLIWTLDLKAQKVWNWESALSLSLWNHERGTGELHASALESTCVLSHFLGLHLYWATKYYMGTRSMGFKMCGPFWGYVSGQSFVSFNSSQTPKSTTHILSISFSKN